MGNEQSAKKIDFDKINLNDIDTYKLFKVSKNNIYWTSLKDNYKKLALICHPDKGGNRRVFNFITNEFKKLAKEAQTQQKSHFEMKKSFESEQQQVPDYGNMTYFDTNVPFHKQFNKLFESYKMNDEDVDFGYGALMEKSDPKRPDINIEKTLDDKISIKKFNQTFNKKVPLTAVSKYVEPEPLHLVSSIEYTNIGKKIDDYTSSIDAKIKYTDYLKAYTEERIPTKSNRPKFKNQQEYEAYSDTFSKKKMTEEELERIEKKKLLEIQIEKERIKRIEKQDNSREDLYNQVSKLIAI